MIVTAGKPCSNQCPLSQMYGSGSRELGVAATGTPMSLPRRAFREHHRYDRGHLPDLGAT
jgi:hypothetical protein